VPANVAAADEQGDGEHTRHPAHHRDRRIGDHPRQRAGSATDARELESEHVHHVG
jgi:hypothetical protein